MKPIHGKSIAARAGRGLVRWAVLPVAIWACSSLLGAQENSAAPVCVPPDLAEFVVSDGKLVQVERVREPAGASRAPRGVEGSGPRAGREARGAYKIFEREAKQGRPAAMVNLAVASLAGWGTRPDAGAALYWLQAAAGAGFTPAFYDLGIVYFRGCGVPQDYAQALRYFELGARQGDPAAQLNLGTLYDHGLGVARDPAAAAGWYRLAARSGEPQAQFNLADLYLRGEGVARDDRAALALLEKAALAGHTGAQLLLGSIYATGHGVARDPGTAYLWFAAAALEGDLRGKRSLDEVELELTPGQIARARLRAETLREARVRSRVVALLH